MLALLTGLLASCSSDGRQQDSLPPEPPPPGDPGTSFAGKAVSYGEVILGNYAPPYELPNHYLPRGTFLRTPSGSAPFFYTLADASPVVVEGGSVSLTTKALAPGGLIYNKGYVYTKTGPSPWVPFSLVPDVEEGVDPDTFIKKRIDENGDIVPTNWIMQKARADLSYTTDEFYTSFFEGENFILNYVCLKPNPIEPWKCGCKAPLPEAASSNDCGYWMLQTFDVCPVGEEWNDNVGACGPPGASLTTPEPVCGDGIVTLGREQCDDGDTTAGNGCDTNCNVEIGWSCNDNEPSQCTADTTPVSPQDARCGDGMLNRAEEYCDDGNAIESDSCTSSCKPSLVCAALPGATIASLDIQVIVDTSGSMEDPLSDPRIKQTVRALRGTDAYPNIGFVDKIFAMPNGASNEIGLTEFSGDASTIFQLTGSIDTATGQSNLAYVDDSMAIIPIFTSSSTGTNYEAGLVKGLADLCGNEGADCTVDPSDSDVAVFMTDGEPLKCTTCGNDVADTNLRQDGDDLYYCGASQSSYRTLEELQQNCPAFTKSLIKQALLLSQEYRTKGARLFVIGFDVKQLPDVCTDEVKLLANAVSSPELTDDEAVALAKCPEVLLKKMALLGGGEYYTARTTADETACATEPDSTACICSSDPENVACIYGELNKAYEDIASVASCLNFCGDATTAGTEACDDGNQENNDACKNDCSENTCGDGVIETGVEDCDGGDGCNADCTLDQTTSSVRDDAVGMLNSALSSFSDSFDTSSFIDTLLNDPVLIAGALQGNDRLVISVETSLIRIGRNTDAWAVTKAILDYAQFEDFKTYLLSPTSVAGGFASYLESMFAQAGIRDSFTDAELNAFAQEVFGLTEEYKGELAYATPDTIGNVHFIVNGILITIGKNADALAIANTLSADPSFSEALTTYFSSINGCLDDSSCSEGLVCSMAQCSEPIYTESCTATDPGVNVVTCIQSGTSIYAPDMVYSYCSGTTTVSYPTCSDNCASTATFDCSSLSDDYQYVCMDGACVMPYWQIQIRFVDADANLLSGVHGELTQNGQAVFSGDSDASGILLVSVPQGVYDAEITKDGFETLHDDGVSFVYTGDNPYDPQNPIQYLTQTLTSLSSLTGRWTLPIQNDAPDNQIVEFTTNDGIAWVGRLVDIGQQLGALGFAAGEFTFLNLHVIDGGSYEGEVLFKALDGGGQIEEWRRVQLTITAEGMTWSVADAEGTFTLMEGMWQRIEGDAGTETDTGAADETPTTYLSVTLLPYNGDAYDSLDLLSSDIAPLPKQYAVDGTEGTLLFDYTDFISLDKTGDLVDDNGNPNRYWISIVGEGEPGSILPADVDGIEITFDPSRSLYMTVNGDTGEMEVHSAVGVTSTLQFTVTDPTGAPLPDAVITVRDQTEVVATAKTGLFGVVSIPVSRDTSYAVTITPPATMTGFTPITINLEVGQNTVSQSVSFATPPVCSDGTKDASEQCDDGNTAQFDNCDASCNIELINNGGFELTSSISRYTLTPDILQFAGITDALWRIAYTHQNEWLATPLSDITIDTTSKFSGSQSAQLTAGSTLSKLAQMIPVSAGNYQFTAQVQSTNSGSLNLRGASLDGSTIFFNTPISISSTNSGWLQITRSFSFSSDGYFYAEVVALPNQGTVLHIDHVSLTPIP